MSFRAQKTRFLVDFSFVSRYFGLSNFCRVEWSLLGVNTAHSFSTTRKTFEKKAASCGQVLQYSTVSKDCFSQLKETAQFSCMTWRE